MPGVRYGPDISDDAAYFVDRVKDIQARIRRGARISRTESNLVRNAKTFANNVFGVSGEDFDRGKFGEMGEMARYGGSRDRSKLAKSWRSGDPMKKSVAQEFADRAAGTDSRGSRTRPAEGTYYVGRTRTARYRQLEFNAQQRLNRNGFTLGKTQARKGSINDRNFKASVDRFNITRTMAGKSDIANRELGGPRPGTRARTTRSGSPAGFSVRPPLAKSQQRQRQRQRRSGGGAAGGSGAGGRSAASRRNASQQARRARNVRNATRPRRAD